MFASMLDADTRIIDLACGTGSNFRYLNPKLGARQRWLCIDYDPEVLARAANSDSLLATSICWRFRGENDPGVTGANSMGTKRDVGVVAKLFAAQIVSTQPRLGFG